MTAPGITRWAAAAVAAAGLFATAVSGQPPRPDPIADARARQKVADQKAEAEVLAAIADAERVARTNPAKALQLLKGAQGNIDLAAAISPEARQTLTGLLQGKINQLQGKGNPAAPGAKADPAGDAAKAGQKQVFDNYVAEVKAVREGLDLIARYRAASRNPEADKIVADLTARYPNNPAVIALTQKDAVGDRLAESKQLADMMDKRVVLALNDVARSSIPPKGDIEFPADWKKRDHRKNTGPELSPKEKSLLAALDKPVTVNFANKPLEEILQELSNMMDQPLVIDARSLNDLGINLKAPTSLDAKGVSARTVLRQVLAGQGLTFVVKDEVIQVLTVEKARDTLTTRVYYLGDLVNGVGPFAGSLTWGPFVDFQQTQANVKLIMDSITGSIDPLCWKEKGGPCTITFHFPSMSIIVRQSAEVHAVLGSKIGAGR